MLAAVVTTTIHPRALFACFSLMPMVRLGTACLTKQRFNMIIDVNRERTCRRFPPHLPALWPRTVTRLSDWIWLLPPPPVRSDMELPVISGSGVASLLKSTLPPEASPVALLPGLTVKAHTSCESPVAMSVRYLSLLTFQHEIRRG